MLLVPILNLSAGPSCIKIFSGLAGGDGGRGCCKSVLRIRIRMDPHLTRSRIRIRIKLMRIRNTSENTVVSCSVHFITTVVRFVGKSFSLLLVSTVSFEDQSIFIWQCLWLENALDFFFWDNTPPAPSFLWTLSVALKCISGFFTETMPPPPLPPKHLGIHILKIALPRMPHPCERRLGDFFPPGLTG
jgi:hypothetical protein